MTTYAQSNNVSNNYQVSPSTWLQYAPQDPGIRRQYNVSSVTYTSTGQYIVNFATAYSNANYYPLVTGSVRSGGTGNTTGSLINTPSANPTTTTLSVATNGAFGFQDNFTYFVVVFGS